jgi:hypothetical protein
MDNAGQAIPGSCSNAKTTAALLARIKKLILSLHVQTQVPKSNFAEPFQFEDVMEKAKGVAA